MGSRLITLPLRALSQTLDIHSAQVAGHHAGQVARRRAASATF